MAELYFYILCVLLILTGADLMKTNHTMAFPTTPWPTTRPWWRTTARMYTTPGPDVWQTKNLKGLMVSVNNGGFLKFRSNSLSDVTALTVCMRAITENSWMIGDQLELSFESSRFRNIQISSSGGYFEGYKLQVGNDAVYFKKQSFVPVGDFQTPWSSRCFTWDSGTGMAQLWFDGMMSVRKGLARGTMFTGHLQLALPYFQGQLTELYVWNRVLDARQLLKYLQHKVASERGAILDWRQMEYSAGGYVLMEPAFSINGPASKHQNGKRRHREKKGRN